MKRLKIGMLSSSLLFLLAYGCSEHKGPNTYNDNEGSATVNSNNGVENSNQIINDTTIKNEDSTRRYNDKP